MLLSWLPQQLAYSASAVVVVLVCRLLWWDHLRLIRFIDCESDTPLYVSVCGEVYRDFTLSM